MRILGKSGGDLLILSEKDDVQKGDYLKILDEPKGVSLVVQVYDIEYFDLPGLEEDILRDLLLGEGVEFVQHEGLDGMVGITERIKNVRVLRCKPRGVLTKDGIRVGVDWLPSRSRNKVLKLRGDEVVSLVISKSPLKKAFRIGTTRDGHPVMLPVEAFDGSLTLILGRKGSGKSHLAKLLVSNLAKHGAYIVVFDLNNEYVGLVRERDGSPSEIAGKVVVLEPGRTLRFNLRYLGRNVMTSVLRNILNLPGVSLREFLRIWDHLEGVGRLSVHELGDYINRWRMNEMVRGALLSRYYTLVSSGLFTDSYSDSFSIEDAISSMPDGGVVVVALASASPLARRIVVEIMLSKLVELSSTKLIPPVFILAEEAHLYIRETYWEDLITRMRHYGIFAIFVTNQPDAIKDYIYRQADNFFLFNYTNSRDLESISRLSGADVDTLKNLVATIERGKCLVVGEVTNWMPIIVSVDDVKFETLGDTRRFFQRIRLLSRSG